MLSIAWRQEMPWEMAINRRTDHFLPHGRVLVLDHLAVGAHPAVVSLI